VLGGERASYRDVLAERSWILPLIPKFASERAANSCELRNRDTNLVFVVVGFGLNLLLLLDHR
jgi:hypothetical protein